MNVRLLTLSLFANSTVATPARKNASFIFTSAIDSADAAPTVAQQDAARDLGTKLDTLLTQWKQLQLQFARRK